MPTPLRPEHSQHMARRPWCGWRTAFVFAAVAVWMRLPRGHAIPAHLLHDAVVLPDLIDEVSFHELRQLVRHLGAAHGYALNTNDLKHYQTEHEHIGEAVPMPPDGRCTDVFMVPSVNRSECILPGRIDIGRHYITTGGVEGLKEGAICERER